jgi:quinoprotein glucose dehydrogenase
LTPTIEKQEKLMGKSPASATAIAPIFLFLLITLYAPTGNAQPGSDWPMYRGNLAGTGYSPLGAIDRTNVAALRIAWRYSLAAEAVGTAQARAVNSQATPIVVGDVMYLPAADRVVALNPVDGTEIWRHEVGEGAPSRRGVSYWPGADGAAPRLFFSAGSRLVALDAATGRPVAAFGQNGEVDIGIPYISVPLVYQNVIVVGANTPPGTGGGVGNPRAYDARTGEKLWEFSSVAQPGQPGHDSWAGDSWIGRLGANAWPFYFTVDEATDLLYLPLASPLPFGYGGDRDGANLYANSIVAVNVFSGAYAWHFQTIHHDLWDHDPPAPPTLFDIETGNGTVPALGVTTKSGYLYILNRETGEPVFGVEERTVAQSRVPGEQTFPTQPIPVKPAPMARVSYSDADLVSAADTSAAHARACAELVAALGEIVNQGPFTPWVYRPDPASGPVTLLFPGLAGGPNWGGVGFDPATRYAFVFSADLGSFGWVEDAEPGADQPYVRSGPRPANFDVAIDGQRLPCQKPPWGQLTAVDTSTGDVAWRQPLGITPGLPADRQNTGRPGRAGVIVTGSGLLFIAATDDDRLRALDARSGAVLWETTLSGRGNANPMTYQGSDGRQYLGIAATDELLVFVVP